MAEFDPDISDYDYDFDLRPCKFPFIYNNKTYDSCTYDYSYATGWYPWCSTKTDENNIHVKGSSARCVDPVNCKFSWKEQASDEEIQLVKENQGKATTCSAYLKKYYNI